jgi:Competence protein
MTLVMFGAVLADRPALSLRNLALAALLVLAREPETLLGSSFQMSFGAVAALVATAPLLTRAVEHSVQRPDLPRRRQGPACVDRARRDDVRRRPRDGSVQHLPFPDGQSARPARQRARLPARRRRGDACCPARRPGLPLRPRPPRLGDDGHRRQLRAGHLGLGERAQRRDGRRAGFRPRRAGRARPRPPSSDLADDAAPAPRPCGRPSGARLGDAASPSGSLRRWRGLRRGGARHRRPLGPSRARSGLRGRAMAAGGRRRPSGEQPDPSGWDPLRSRRLRRDRGGRTTHRARARPARFRGGLPAGGGRDLKAVRTGELQAAAPLRPRIPREQRRRRHPALDGTGPDDRDEPPSAGSAPMAAARAEPAASAAPDPDGRARDGSAERADHRASRRPSP